MSRFSTFFAQVFSGKGRSLKWEALLQIIWVLVGTAIFVCTSRPTPPIQLFLHLFHLLLPDYSLFLRLLLLLLLPFLHLTFPLLSLLPPPFPLPPLPPFHFTPLLPFHPPPPPALLRFPTLANKLPNSAGAETRGN